MSALPRALFIFGIILPLAVAMGYLMSEPLDQMSMIGLGGLLAVLLSPFLIKYHHFALVLTAGAYVNAFFLPGQPLMWMFLGGLSFAVSLVSWPLDRTSRVYCGTPSCDYAMIFLLFVLLFTIWMAGGVGFKIFGGGTYGGRRYVSVFAACISYFALVMIPIPLRLAAKTAGFYFISGISAVFGNLTYILGPAFYFLFLLFPVDFVLSQAGAEIAESAGFMSRSVSLGIGGIAIISFLFCRYGMAALLQRKVLWHWLLIAAAIGLILASGFRSNFILVGLLVVFQFFFEGLHKTKYLPIAAATLAAGMVLIFSFSNKLPVVIQRGLSFLPIEIDRQASIDAQSSLEWRLEMWKVVVEDIPKYFWIGKGFTVNPTDLYFAQEGVKRGVASGYEWAIVAGDYHSGPLSVIIPFGIWGTLGLFWLLIAGYRVLKRNYLYGIAELRVLNRFFMVFFLAHTVFFFVFFGNFSGDLWLFSSLVGLNLSINRGVASKPVQVFSRVMARERPLALKAAASPT